MSPRHDGKHLVANLIQKRVIAPGCIGNDVMQRLMHLAYVARSQTCRHRLHALALDRQHESLRIVLDRNHAISMSGGFCQTIKIDLQTFPLTREIQLARAHSINVLPDKLHRQNNRSRGIYFITQ